MFKEDLLTEIIQRTLGYNILTTTLIQILFLNIMLNQALKTDTQFKSIKKANFCFITITAMDNLDNKFRYQLIYIFFNYMTTQWLCMKLFLFRCYTATSSIISFGAFSAEREIWDMYSIFFLNHEDQRRILTDYGFKGHPLRKDFPLVGFLEISFSIILKTLQYKKVSLAQEFRNFNFMNPWSECFLNFWSKKDTHDSKYTPEQLEVIQKMREYLERPHEYYYGNFDEFLPEPGPDSDIKGKFLLHELDYNGRFVPDFWLDNVHLRHWDKPPINPWPSWMEDGKTGLQLQRPLQVPEWRWSRKYIEFHDPSRKLITDPKPIEIPQIPEKPQIVEKTVLDILDSTFNINPFTTPDNFINLTTLIDRIPRFFAGILALAYACYIGRTLWLILTTEPLMGHFYYDYNNPRWNYPNYDYPNSNNPNYDYFNYKYISHKEFLKWHPTTRIRRKDLSRTEIIKRGIISFNVGFIMLPLYGIFFAFPPIIAILVNLYSIIPD